MLTRWLLPDIFPVPQYPKSGPLEIEIEKGIKARNNARKIEGKFPGRRTLMVFPSIFTDLVANSTPIVLLLSRLNSFRVKRDSKLLLPTPESPIKTTRKHGEKTHSQYDSMQMWPTFHFVSRFFPSSSSFYLWINSRTRRHPCYATPCQRIFPVFPSSFIQKVGSAKSTMKTKRQSNNVPLPFSPRKKSPTDKVPRVRVRDWRTCQWNHVMPIRVRMNESDEWFNGKVHFTSPAAFMSHEFPLNFTERHCERMKSG